MASYLFRLQFLPKSSTQKGVPTEGTERERERARDSERERERERERKKERKNWPLRTNEKAKRWKI